MPRPKSGYVNAAGQPIPGTNDITKRFMDSGGLVGWAFNRGKQGLPLYDRSAIDIGSVVHHMADLDLRGRPDREIEQEAHERLCASEHLQKTWHAFREFRAWRQQCHIRAIASEISLVSETYQYGGTPDHIVMVGNEGNHLLEIKTANKAAVYSNFLVTMAGHGNLWTENKPQQPLSGYRLLVLPKDGSAFQANYYPHLEPYWEMFKLERELYALDQQWGSQAGMKQAAMPAAAPRTRSKPDTYAPAPSARLRSAPKPRPRIDAPRSCMTMGEMLRAYGHVKELSL